MNTNRQVLVQIAVYWIATKQLVLASLQVNHQHTNVTRHGTVSKIETTRRTVYPTDCFTVERRMMHGLISPTKGYGTPVWELYIQDPDLKVYKDAEK